MKSQTLRSHVSCFEGLAIPDVHAKFEGVHRYAERAGLHGHPLALVDEMMRYRVRINKIKSNISLHPPPPILVEVWGLEGELEKIDVSHSTLV
jgi:hypothetical protein